MGKDCEKSCLVPISSLPSPSVQDLSVNDTPKVTDKVSNVNDKSVVNDKVQLVIDPSVVTDTTQLVNDKSLPIGRNLRPRKYFFDQYPTSFLKLILNQCLYFLGRSRVTEESSKNALLSVSDNQDRSDPSSNQDEATDLPPPNVGDQGEFLISCQLNWFSISGSCNYWFYNLAAHLMLSHSAGDIPAIETTVEARSSPSKSETNLLVNDITDITPQGNL